MNRIERMQQLLSPLKANHLEITDNSHLHAGHEGARSGGGHYALFIVSEQFAGKNTLSRQRMIYSALGDMMKHDIHALEIKACTPQEI